VPQNEALIHKYSEMFRFVQTALLTDAELAEDISKNLVSRYLANDFGEVREALTEVFTNKVATHLIFE